MPKFRARTPDVYADAQVWTVDTDTPDDPVSVETDSNGLKFGILHTHTDQFRVNDGDVIVRAASGELCVMRPDAFALAFEPVASEAPSKRIAKGSE